MTQLLFEIGTEEIPASYIEPALAFMEQSVQDKLKELGLGFGAVHTVGTPRRLTLAVDDLQASQEDRRQEHIGPAKKAAFDADGQATKAAQGFARSRGVAVEDLQIVETAKGEYLMAVEEIKGQETEALLPDLLDGLLRALPFPKSMRWADSSMAFARPIQWLLALYDGKVVDLTVEGVKAGATTLGHRFMSPEAVEIENFQHYQKTLEAKSVVVDQRARREAVIKTVKQAVQERIGDKGRPVLDEGLIDIVTNLVEIPWGICGSFDKKFLALPDEALITSMREHQKYFPVVDSEGRLMPFFVAVNNTDIQDRKMAASGHERVLRARLEDGLFFFNEDKKKPLEDRLQALSGIIFQRDLGTMAEKSERLMQISAYLAEQLAPDTKKEAKRAAQLAKTDLLTEMVGEFPSLQGIIGRDYALLDGEKTAVADAVQEHYQPVRAGGTLPASLLGAIVGLADRIDTMVGCFAINERPTGNKDAFGQRRLAVGMIHIIRHHNLHLSLNALAEQALQGYADKITPAEDTLEAVIGFIRLRFENDLIASGMKQEVVEAATSAGFDDLTDCLARIEALDGMRNREEFAVLAGSFKRIRNITKGNRETGVDPALFAEEAEKELYSTYTAVQEQVRPMIANRAYSEALAAMLTMKEPVDRFFDDVMVMDKNLAVRANRLNLLTGLGDLVRQVGDISRMHVE
ncbi:MAG: glycine--tRNA ligase subunit beta [Candidatus Electrothrix aestuarii]|uniref:Glycine--tRNA ligase beta subunit n=1 Tax=Candidatus Electrothrix aestuarii TaxID=3062594 RepID=A0AAU8LQD4_9BACT|nr:glycine--tRNA ligase subunit beta [Candidatus Electrothrix aestuarii]